MGSLTGLASLSKYIKEQPHRILTRLVGTMRKFPPEAIGVSQQIKLGNNSTSPSRCPRISLAR